MSTTTIESIDFQKQSILQEKIDNLLTRNQVKTAQVLEKIDYDNEHLQDFVLPLKGNEMLNFESNGTIKMNFNDNAYDISDHALGQLADKMDIPARYLKQLSETQWGRDLAQKVLTEHKENIGRNRILVRTVDNEARGVLSDKYRRLNSDKIYHSFSSAIRTSGAVIYDACYTSTKTYMEAIIPHVIPLQTANNGVVYSVFGARIRNSDFGNGSLELRIFQMNVVCLNGMVGETAWKQVHLGTKLPDNINFSEQTYRLDTATSASKIKDVVGDCLSIENIKAKASRIQEASAELIDVKKELVKLPKLGFLKEDVSSIEELMMNSNPEQGVVGQPTRWKLSQAMTAHANSDDISESRKRELAELAGGFLKL